MAMMRMTSVVAILWVVLTVGISLEKCRGEDLSGISSEKHSSGMATEEKGAKYQKAKEKAEAAFKEAKEIWSNMSSEEKEKVKEALKEAKEKAGAAKGHPWSEKAIEKVETALKEAKEKAKDKADATWLEKVEEAIKEAKEKAESKTA